MYLTLKDRPGTQDGAGPSAEAGRARRPRVAPVVLVLGMVSLLTDISSESVAAILPIYLTTVVGLSAVSFGLIDGLYQGVSALVRIAGGWAADRSGHPKWVAVFGYGLSAVARGFLLVSTGVVTIAAVISADRVGKGIRTAPRDAIIAASSPPDLQATAFGVHRTLDTVGAAIGPLVAFAVLWWIPDGYAVVMAISLACAVVGVLLLGLFVPDRYAPRHRPATARPAPLRTAALCTHPGMGGLIVVAGTLGLLTVGDGFLYLALLDRVGFAAHWFPLLYVGTNVAFLALAVPLGRLADRVGKARVLVGGHVLLLAAYLCAAGPWAGVLATVATLLLLGAFYAATDGVIAALAGRLVPPEGRARGIAIAQTVVAVSRMVATFGFGLLWFTLGPQVALVAVAVALCGALVPALRAARRLDLLAGSRS